MPISSWITRLHFCVFLRLQGCENLFSSHGNPSCFQLHLKLLENCWTFSCLLWLGLVMSRSVSLMPSHTFSNGTLSPIFIKGITEPLWGRFSTFQSCLWFQERKRSVWFLQRKQFLSNFYFQNLNLAVALKLRRLVQVNFWRSLDLGLLDHGRPCHFIIQITSRWLKKEKELWLNTTSSWRT